MRQLMANVQLDVGIGHRQGLCVRVGSDELDPSQPGVDHPVDRVSAAATDADDLDDCQVTAAFHEYRPTLELALSVFPRVCRISGVSHGTHGGAASQWSLPTAQHPLQIAEL